MARKATGRKAPARSGAARPAARKAEAKPATRKSAEAEPKKKAAAKAAPATRKAAKPAPAKKAPARKAVAKAAPAKKATAKAATAKTAAARAKTAPHAATRKAAAKTSRAVAAKTTRKATSKSARPAAPKAAKRAAPARKAVAPAARKAAPAKRVTRKVAAAAPARLKSSNGPQRFTVSHMNEADFKKDGLRPYALYRDLGVAEATAGLCQAHVIRMIPPCTDEVRERHVHAVELQLVYVLKGWMKNEFEGHGEQMMSAGSCWIQPPGIKHTVLDYSADLEVLEIIVPADFKTVAAD